MISTPSKLSQIICDESSSFLFHSSDSKQQLNALRKQLALLPQSFSMFKEQILGSLREWLGKISALVYRQAKEKTLLQSQLQKSKQVQQKMRSQVIQLKEMINDAMIGYTKELQSKDNEIRKLKALLQHKSEQQSSIKIQDEEIIQADLEIIQQQSQQATFSSARTLREFKDQERQFQNNEKAIFQEISSTSQIKISLKKVQESQIVIYQQKSQTDPVRNDHKRTKSFIDNFRKTIEESFMQKQLNNSKPFAQNQQIYQSQKQNIIQVSRNNWIRNLKPDKPVTNSQPLRQITNKLFSNQNKVYENSNSSIIKQIEAGFNRPKITFSVQQFRDVSNISNSSQLTRTQQSSQVLSLKNFQTPKSQSFFKKKEHQRIMTEPSIEMTPSQNYFSSKPLETNHQRKSSQRTSSYQQAKSKHSMSKQKIKVTSRIIEEMNQVKRNPNSSNTKAVVHLGGGSKCVFRKFLLQLKQAFKKYVICVGLSQQEVKYQGQKRNKLRWGKGRLFYRTGMVYQGQFKENLRHGRGTLFMNGTSIYEGQWVAGQLQGQGYVKSMKYTSKDCPCIFNQSSFCGNLLDNRLHGIGTIFLNKKQKIVTKFNFGVPIGQLTYYNLHEIEFGVWPSQ